MSKARRSAGLRNTHAVDQCALYMVGSKRRLAALLMTDLSCLLGLYKNSDNYRIFFLKPRDDPFSTKRKPRWAQEPKYELRKVHARILWLLAGIAPPPYLHSATKGRSYRTNAARHLGSERLLKLDVRRFFPSTTESRVFAFFRETMKCAPDVSRLLARICSWKGVIPTGSPLSPLLTYYANKPMFDDLDALAAARGLRFTCYVDDLAFSGRNLARGFSEEVEGIVARHGHVLAHEKTRFFRKGSAKELTGVVIDGPRLRVPNSRFQKARRLKAAISTEADFSKKLRLVERLNGLAGEASQIDERFNGWSARINRELRTLRRKKQLDF